MGAAGGIAIERPGRSLVLDLDLDLAGGGAVQVQVEVLKPGSGLCLLGVISFDEQSFSAQASPSCNWQAGRSEAEKDHE